MTDNYLRVGDRAYLLGLTWRYHDQKPGIGELRSRARALGRWVLLYPTRLGAWQSAYAAELPAMVPSRDCRALAGELASTAHAHFLGICDLGDGRYWMLAVGEDQVIQPDGDQVGSLEQIEAACSHVQSQGNWKIELLDLPGVLARIAGAGAGAVGPRDVSVARRVPALLLLGAVLLGASLLAYGSLQWRQLQRQRQRVERAQHQRPAAPPWAGVAATVDVLDGCAAAWSEQPLAQAGWRLYEWTCSVEHRRLQLRSVWHDDGGSTLLAPGILAGDGSSSSSSRSGSVLPLRETGVAADAQTASRQLWALRPWFSPAAGSGGSSGDSVRLDSPAPPWSPQWAAALARVSGLRLQSVRWRDGSAWTCLGHLYFRGMR